MIASPGEPWPSKALCVCVCVCVRVCVRIQASVLFMIKDNTHCLFPDRLPHVVPMWYFLHLGHQVRVADLAECRQPDFSVGICDRCLPCWEGVGFCIFFKETIELKMSRKSRGGVHPNCETSHGPFRHTHSHRLRFCK